MHALERRRLLGEAKKMEQESSSSSLDVLGSETKMERQVVLLRAAGHLREKIGDGRKSLKDLSRAESIDRKLHR